MKAPLFIGLIFLFILSMACQTENQRLPEHAQEVRAKLKQQDSLRSLEIIEALRQDSIKLDSSATHQE